MTQMEAALTNVTDDFDSILQRVCAPQMVCAALHPYLPDDLLLRQDYLRGQCEGE